jgi:hypothetical protein
MHPPAPPSCLTRAYSDNPGQRGGTLIAEDVVDREEHRRRLSDPDNYRPERCPHCDHDRLHAHDFRERHVRGEGGRETFRRYRCASCSGVWFVLAAFMARYLHHSWRCITRAVELTGGDDDEVGKVAPVSASTCARWADRLASTAALVVQSLVLSGVDLGEALASRSRLDLVVAMVRAKLLSAARPLAQLAGWLHRVKVGLRLV